MRTDTIDQVAAAANKTTIAGGGLAGFGWLTSNEIYGLIGAAVAVVGLLVTWYYKREANRRHAELHEIKMARLRAGLDDPTDTDNGGL